MAQLPNGSHPRAWFQLRLESLDSRRVEFHCPCCGAEHTLELTARNVPEFPVIAQMFCQKCYCHFTMQVDGFQAPAVGEAMAVNRPEVRQVAAALERTLQAETVRLVHTPIGSAPAAWTPPPQPERRGLLTWLGDLLFPGGAL